MEKLEAGILGTVFRNEENGWTVLTVRAGRSEVTVVGTLPELSPGEQAVFDLRVRVDAGVQKAHANALTEMTARKRELFLRD